MMFLILPGNIQQSNIRVLVLLRRDIYIFYLVLFLVIKHINENDTVSVSFYLLHKLLLVANYQPY